MRTYRRVWLVALLAGLVLVGTALVGAVAASDISAQEAGAVAQAEDCEDDHLAQLHGVPVDDLPPAQTGDDPCLNCHTDAERLKGLAVEEVVETLSEGPG